MNLDSILQFKEAGLPAQDIERVLLLDPDKQRELLRQLQLRKQIIASDPMLKYQPTTKQRLGHETHSKIIAYFGGNRAGKTTFGAAEVVWHITGTHPYKKVTQPPVKWWCLSPELPVVKGDPHVQLDKVRKMLPEKYLIGGSWQKSWSVQARLLTLTNGSWCRFRSYKEDVDTFYGEDLDGLWCDEECPKPIMDSSQMRLIDRGGITLITMTPENGMTYTYTDIYEKANLPDGRIFAVTVGIFDNPYLNRAEIERIAAGLDENTKRVKLHGEFVKKAGIVYNEFDAALHVLPEDITPPKHWPWVMAMDVGIEEPTAVLWAQVSPDNALYIIAEHYESGRTANYHAAKVRAMEKILRCERPLRFMCPWGFTRGGPETRSWDMEYREQGLVFRRGNKDVDAGINQVKQRLARYIDKDGEWAARLYVNPRCVNLIREMTRDYEWKTVSDMRAAQGYTARDRPAGKDDHTCDCLRYIAMAKMLAPPRDMQEHRQKVTIWRARRARGKDRITGY